MQIAEVRRDGVVAVVPTGRIDTTTAAALEGHLNVLMAGGARRVVVDFSRVDYISSAGLRVLLIVARRMSESSGRLFQRNQGCEYATERAMTVAYHSTTSQLTHTQRASPTS